jgi:hypothetical protein
MKVKPDEKQLQESLARYEALRRELVSLTTRMGLLLTGSVQSRFFQCTRDNRCRCHDNPAYRHGPYHYWTRGEKGKTVSVGVPEQQLGLFKGWSENTRALERVVSEMRHESLRAIALTTGRGQRTTKTRRRRLTRGSTVAYRSMDRN